MLLISVLKTFNRLLRLSQRGYWVVSGVVLALLALAFAISFLPGYHDPIMSTLTLLAFGLFALAFIFRFRGLGYRLIYLLPPVVVFALGGWGMAATIAVSVTGGGETLKSPIVQLLRACFYVGSAWFLVIALMGFFPDRVAASGRLSRWFRTDAIEAQE